MRTRDTVLLCVFLILGVLLALRGGSAEILAALFGGFVLGRLQPVYFP